jgi:hypothetical protein
LLLIQIGANSEANKIKGGEIMTIFRKSCLMVTAILLGFSLTACEKKAGEGPAERAGKEVDKAMEKAGQAMDKAADAVKEAAKDATKKVEEVAKDAADKATTATKDK